MNSRSRSPKNFGVAYPNWKTDILPWFPTTFWKSIIILTPIYKDLFNKKLDNNDVWHLESLSFTAIVGRQVYGLFCPNCQSRSCDSKSNQWQVHIFWFCFHSFQVYSIDSSKMFGNFPHKVSDFNRLFLKLNRSICN